MMLLPPIHALSRRTPSADSDHHQIRVTWGNEEVHSPSHRKGQTQGRQGI